MDKLSREEVLHVLDLARLNASDEEIEKYRVELKQMITEIDKIKDINDFDSDYLIAPWSNESTLRDNGSILISKDNVLKNVPNKKGNFVSLDVEVLKDE
ncbi:MAG: aspartyl/glutamyl-tRNA amidotransferase subunit C [Bacilli bacterium]|nr:aspartyl/glutamyl-tRNA amidotransferase subunit C [Bacilli bacterium]